MKFDDDDDYYYYYYYCEKTLTQEAFLYNCMYIYIYAPSPSRLISTGLYNTDGPGLPPPWILWSTESPYV